ncbi:hypothetical protein NEOLEDRAFT_1136211 [Neolentinus lepideus HHB14362 ss-1]|uniref:Uncharacterized protein n=1 Tax=Neolentinus lepideus HHB14362 ss-1 TaxID=1314782 RepID=A0A165REY6_9AGAM|nr:hypothetical protein NEOLEDRAFT_1136211 [Neolentinus lepideus HHB14362 ss-1]
MADSPDAFRDPPTTTSSGLGDSGSATIEDIHPPQNFSLTLRSPPSEMEARRYYTGLPSQPVLVARTSTTPWLMARGRT